MSVAQDLDTLARTLYGEARGESLEGLFAVGWVILNRVSRGGRFGTTVAEVCKRPLQFSCWNSNDPNYSELLAANVEQPAFLRCFGAACLVMSRAVPDPTGGADHYFAASMAVSPSWASPMHRTERIGHHIFLKETA